MLGLQDARLLEYWDYAGILRYQDNKTPGYQDSQLELEYWDNRIPGSQEDRILELYVGKQGTRMLKYQDTRIPWKTRIYRITGLQDGQDTRMLEQDTVMPWKNRIYRITGLLDGQDTRIPGYQEYRTLGYQDARILGYQNTRTLIRILQDTWTLSMLNILGYHDTWTD